MNKELVPSKTKQLVADEMQLLQKALTNVREEMEDNPYIKEAVRVIPVRGYRSAIGSYWNAVVDDLRRKIIHRSLDLFNKEMNLRNDVKTYEDFQNNVTDIDLIEGAYKIGVIGWEARRILNQARETRNIFDGHPSSTEPSLIKVLDVISDCNKYVLSQEYPPPIVDINTYLVTLDSPDYDRNEMAVEQAFSDLPSVYKTELINKLYSTYTHESSSTTLRANIEFCTPILWSVLTKEDRLQIGRRLDQNIVAGNRKKIEYGTEFLIKINGLRYVSNSTRKAIFEPAIRQLESVIDNWSEEGEATRYLERLGTNIPDELIERYVVVLTLTFVGYKGTSMRYARTDFYSDAAAPIVKCLFAKFDDKAAEAFIKTVREDEMLKRRIQRPGQLARLRILANILLDRSELRSDIREFLELMVDEERTGDFFKEIK